MSRLLDVLTSRLAKPEEINGASRCPTYLYRWELLSIASGWARVYLHKFVGDDWALDLHDHPKRFWSIGLAGSYIEIRHAKRWRRWTAPWIRSFPAEHRHRLIGPTPESPCWTLVIVGPPVREWGFWSVIGFQPWKQYVSLSNPHAKPSCT